MRTAINLAFHSEQQMAEWGTPAVERIQKASRSKILEYVVLLFSLLCVLCLNCFVARGGAVASWLVRSTLERAVRVRALAGDIVLNVFFGKTRYSHSASLHPVRLYLFYPVC